jgi:hypothetical protein
MVVAFFDLWSSQKAQPVFALPDTQCICIGLHLLVRSHTIAVTKPTWAGSHAMVNGVHTMLCSLAWGGNPAVYQEGGRMPVSASPVPIASEAWRNVYIGNGQMDLYPGMQALLEESLWIVACCFTLALPSLKIGWQYRTAVAAEHFVTSTCNCH